MISKLTAEYRETDGERRCGNCSMFRKPNHCTYVHGFIRPADTCKFWAKSNTQEDKPQSK